MVPARGDAWFDDAYDDGINGTNAAKDITATFTAAGTYDLLATVTDQGALTAPNHVTVVVNHTPTSIVVTPDGAALLPGQHADLTAIELDQFGNRVEPQPPFSWALNAAGTVQSDSVGSISQGGVYTARSDVYPDGTPFSGGLPVYATDAAADGLQGTRIVTVPACGGYVFQVDSVSYPVSATLDDRETVTGTLSVGNTNWVSMSDPGDLNNVVGQAYDVLWKGLTLSGSLTYTYPDPNPPPPRIYTFPQDSLVFSMERTGWIDAAEDAAYHYDVASSTFTLPVVVGKDTSENPISYPFTVHAILVQQMKVAEHGNADSATTATGGHDGNLVVRGDDQGVGHVDLTGLFKPMTTGSNGTEGQVNVKIWRNDDPTHPILSGNYADLLASGKLQNVALPTDTDDNPETFDDIDTADDRTFTITTQVAGSVAIPDLCMAAAPNATATVQVAKTQPSEKRFDNDKILFLPYSGPDGYKKRMQEKYGTALMTHILPPGWNGQLTKVTQKHNRLFWDIPDGALVGTEACEGCIGLIIVEPGIQAGDVTVRVFHFDTFDNPRSTLNKILRGLPSGCHAVVFGGQNHDTASMGTLRAVIQEVGHFSWKVTIDGVQNSSGMWVDNHGRYYVRQDFDHGVRDGTRPFYIPPPPPAQ